MVAVPSGRHEMPRIVQLSDSTRATSTGLLLKDFLSDA
jgi:hypothetical protein